MCNADGEFDLDEALWAPGVDYVGGWRDAQNAGDELVAALSAAWPDAEGATAVAQSGPRGSGLVRLRLPAATARALADLIRTATASHDARRAAS